MTQADAAIAEIVALYCHAIDRRRWPAMARCFHADATYSFGPIDGSWRDFVRVAQTMIDPLPMTHHQLGQTLRASDGEGRVRAETYFTATHHVLADAAPDAAFAGRGRDYHAIFVGRYVDLFTLRGGDWRIERRVGVVDARYDVTPTVDAIPVFGPDDPAFSLAGGA